MTLTLPGRVPSKKNSKRIIQVAGRPRLISSAAFLAWHEEQLWRLRKPAKPLEGRNVVSITFFSDTARQFDLSNSAESVMDLLVDAGILADDNWLNVPELHLAFGGVDRKKPRAEVKIATAIEPG